MELSIDQQFFEQIKRASSIIIALPEQLGVDAVVSAVGMRLFLRKLGKQAIVASSGTLPPAQWNFLPEPPELVNSLAGSGSLVIALDTSGHELGELSYQSVGKSVHIFLKAKDGAFTPEDVTVSAQAGNFDLIITLGVSSFEDLGRLYQDSPELFLNLPKINIDLQTRNEYFGSVNLVDVTASSLGELLAVSLAKYETDNPLDADIATCFLAGIIARTHSFQQPQTTPQTLSMAAFLIQQGARQQDIIVSLYKTKDFSLLKLWGRALARLKTSQQHSLLYTSLNAADFERTASGPEMLVPVLREFIDNVSGFQIIAILAEISDSTIRIILAAPPHIALPDLLSRIAPVTGEPEPLRGVYRYVFADAVNQTLPQVEKKLLEAADHFAVA